MLYDLCIYDKVKHVEYRKQLYKKNYLLGRSIENDFVLLDSNIPLQWKKITKENKTYQIHQLSSADHDKRYSISIRFSRLFHSACIGLFLSLLYGVFLSYQHFKASHLIISEKKLLPTKNAYGVFQQNQDNPHFHEIFYFVVEKEIEKPQVLHFGVGNILKTDQLKILINKNEIGFAQATEKSWSEEQRIMIPKDFIEVGENEVSFQLKRSVKNEKRWGVRNIYIKQMHDKQNHQFDLENFKKYLESFLSIPRHDEQDFLRIEKMSKEYQKIKNSNHINSATHYKIEHMLAKVHYKKKAFMKQMILAEERQKQLKSILDHESEEF